MDGPNQVSQDNLNALIATIKRGECAIILGAGPSMPIGYPSLQKLLWEMARETKLADLQAKEIDENWAGDFQIIKNTVGIEQYQKTLGRIFDHKTRSVPYNPILINILNIPFCAFVTTNYDPCLEFASANLTALAKSHSYSYPNLPIAQLTQKHIFHPHGYIEPKNPNSINSIILSQDEFREAYEETQTTYMFFRALFDDLDILFVGFGLNDIVILDILEKTKQLREIREGIAVKKNYQLSRQKSKFAILDNETYERDKNKANFVGRLGITPIIYEKFGESHYLLNQLIEEIQRKTSEQTIFPVPTVPEDFLEPLEDFHG